MTLFICLKVPQSLEKMNQSKQNSEFVNQQVSLLKEKELIANGRQNAKSRNNSKDLRIRNGIILFTTLTCFLNFFRIIGHVHYSGSKRMLERHFGFTTTETGFLQSVDNIIGIVGYLIGGYLGDKVHKARLIAVCSLISSLSILSTSLPYFLTSGLNDHHMDYTFVKGAWWLGFIITGIPMFFFTIPMFFFPASLKRTEDPDEKATKKERKPYWQHIKGKL